MNTFLKSTQLIGSFIIVAAIGLAHAGKIMLPNGGEGSNPKEEIKDFRETFGPTTGGGGSGTGGGGSGSGVYLEDLDMPTTGGGGSGGGSGGNKPFGVTPNSPPVPGKELQKQLETEKVIERY